jgi:uncharacterized protein
MNDNQGRVIGKIVQVYAEKLVVELLKGRDNFTVVGFDDIHYVARLGSYVMIPVQSMYVVGEIVGLRNIESNESVKTTGQSDRLDKAWSTKFLDVVPVGMLPQVRDGEFKFGVTVYPSLHADALYAMDDELDRIFEVAGAIEVSPPGSDGESTRYKALPIGTSVVFQDYEVKVRVDEFFGGHSAILGNTGSGKSCTVATILQSLFDKPDEHLARQATFVVLDVNGEYRQAFAKLRDGVRRTYMKVSADPSMPGAEVLDPREVTQTFRLPHWFMSVEEWELLLRASERTQQPILRTALGLSSLFSDARGEELNDVRNHIVASCLICILASDASSPSKADHIKAIISKFGTEKINRASITGFVGVSFGSLTNQDALIAFLETFIRENVKIPGYRHLEFEFEQLEDAIDLALLYEEAHGNRQIRDYCSQMVTRLKWIKEREEFAFLRVSPAKLHADERQLESFVNQFLGIKATDNEYFKTSQIIILDMNDAADEVVEVASAVVSRLIFERLRNAEPRNHFPVHLVLEEAHRYVADKPTGYAIDASKVFERIAKEGRKYGIFFVLASQRPSELSKTVLSQCSNFIVHRIQNPDDLSHIRQMTPFVSESVMKRLPSLPKQHALIFGNAINLPTTFRVRDVSPKPKSDDAAIRYLWFADDGEPVGLLPRAAR